MAVKSGEDVEVARFDTDSGTCGIDAPPTGKRSRLNLPPMVL
jgi:hypothetical protein